MQRIKEEKIKRTKKSKFTLRNINKIPAISLSETCHTVKFRKRRVRNKIAKLTKRNQWRSKRNYKSSRVFIRE